MADGTIKIDTKIDQKGIDQGIKDMQKNLEGTAKKLKSTGKTMSKAVTAPIVGLGTVAFAAADQVDKAYNNIRVGTGATGEDLEDLKQSFENVFVNVPESADAVSSALSNVNTYTGATGETLEDLTKNVMDASRMLGEDGTTNAQIFGQALNQFGRDADEGTDILDGLFAVTQKYGIGLGEVTGELNSYGSVLQNAGFTMEESADLMGRLHDQGLSVSRVMPGLNTAFRNWATEGKEPRKELENLIGELGNAEEGTEAFAQAVEIFGAEGVNRLKVAIDNGVFSMEDLGDVLGDTQGLIAETNEDTKTMGQRFGEMKNEVTMALQPLGEILLDLAERAIDPLIEGIQRVADWFKNLSPAMQNTIVIVGGLLAAIGPLLIVVGTLISAFTTILPIIKLVGAAIGLLFSPISLIIAAIVGLVAVVVIYWEEIRDFTIEVFTAIGEFLAEAWEWIKETASEAWTAIAEFFVATWEWITEVFTTAIEAVQEFITGAWEWIKETTETVFTAIGDFFSMIWETYVTIVTTYIEIVQTIVSTVFNAIKSVIETIWNGISNFLSGLWDGISNAASTVFGAIRDTISNIFGSIRDTASSIWNGIRDTISGIVNGIRDTVSSVFNGIRDTISGVWDSISGTTSRIWDGIVDSIKGAINGVIGAINGMLNAIGNISITLPKVPDWVPGIGGAGGKISFPSIPNIPSLDVGTNFVARDGLAFLHQGEAVVPKEYNPAADGNSNKVPVNLNLTLGTTNFKAFVEDITEVQDRENRTLERFKG